MRIVLLIIFCLASSLSYCSEDQLKYIENKLLKNNVSPIDTGGFLFKAEKNGTQFYLYGVAHSVKVNDDELPITRSALKAFSASDYYVDESEYADTSNEVQNNLSRNDSQFPYASRLSKEEIFMLLISMGVYDTSLYIKISSGLKGLSGEDNEKAQMALAKMSEEYMPNYWIVNAPEWRCKDNKPAGKKKSTEKTFIAMAEQFGKPVLHLQDVNEYLTSVFRSMPIDEQLAALRASLRFRVTPSAYCDGGVRKSNLKDFEGYLSEWRNHSDASLRHVYKILNSDRNIIFYNKMMDITKQNGVGFFAVGATHLLFEDGLLAMLKGDGFKVELIQ